MVTGIETYDVVVVGSGGGGLSAALFAALEGLSVIVLEKCPHFGGTTSRSGGGAWLPGNPIAREMGIQDDPAAARRYVQAVLGEHCDAQLMDAYFAAIAPMVSEFRARTEVDFVVAPKNPDYHSAVPGSGRGGRTCYAAPYDGGRLGARLKDLRAPLPELTLGGMYIGSGLELAHFSKGIRSWSSTRFVLRRLAEHCLDVITHGRVTRLTNGAALIARLTKSLLDRAVEIRLSTTVEALTRANNSVTGVMAANGERRYPIVARRGVVLACGGFPNDLQRRLRVYPDGANGPGYVTPTPAENTGDGIRMGEGAGGSTLDVMDKASWCPMSRVTRPDGTQGVFPHFMDRQKPGVIAVTRAGVRFCNEAESYHDFVKQMFAACGGKVPISAYLITDHRSLRRYGLGNVKPSPLPLTWHLKSGYLLRGRSVAELARVAGIDESALVATVAAYNIGAHQGIDPKFRRGESDYDRYLGDPEHRPNPCIAPIMDAPIYAIKVEPGEIGTCLGLATNRHAQVVDSGGAAIEGLYAVGNDMSSIFSGDYVGGGATLGPALTFGYIAGKHLAKSAPR